MYVVQQQQPQTVVYQTAAPQPMYVTQQPQTVIMAQPQPMVQQQIAPPVVYQTSAPPPQYAQQQYPPQQYPPQQYPPQQQYATPPPPPPPQRCEEEHHHHGHDKDSDKDKKDKKDKKDDKDKKDNDHDKSKPDKCSFCHSEWEKKTVSKVTTANFAIGAIFAIACVIPGLIYCYCTRTPVECCARCFKSRNEDDFCCDCDY